MRFRSAWIGAVALGLSACGGNEPATTPSAPTPISPPPISNGPPSASVEVTVEGDCTAPGFASAALANAESLGAMSLDLFGRAEIGWEVYAPVVAREIGTSCGPQTQGFAKALSAWAPGASPDGIVTLGTLTAVKAVAQGRRPIVAVRAKNICPEPPADANLETARTDEGYQGKVVQLRPGALAAYRAMTAAARAEVPEVAGDPRFLTIFSAYRSPAYDAARCARDGNCNGVTRATCSPHRTGLAMDIYVGESPGFGPDSSVDSNRLAQSRTAAYGWLVKNAGRFGFAGYAFEPWHWEWTGEAP